MLFRSLDDMAEKDETRYGLEGSPTSVQRIYTPEHGGTRDLWRDDGPALANILYGKLVELKFV